MTELDPHSSILDPADDCAGGIRVMRDGTMQGIPTPLLITKAEAAIRLGLTGKHTRHAVLGLVRRGVLRGVVIAGRTMIDPRSVAELVTPEQVAVMLGIDQVAKNPLATVRRMIMRGELDGVRVGMRTMLLRASVVRLIVGEAV